MLPTHVIQECTSCQVETSHIKNLARIDLMKSNLSIDQQATRSDEIFEKKEIFYFECDNCKTVSFKAK
ncbi:MULTISPECIES: hypothetical protein [unclassified Acinetobacter]|uniref:hypothetical protein n=1 Tax=unclassified Acinetobacter TaxID=196816 RepID=UPI0015D19DE2|nr:MULTISPECIES: hypothetical protein [unclassified Acinetobacter]